MSAIQHKPKEGILDDIQALFLIEDPHKRQGFSKLIEWINTAFAIPHDNAISMEDQPYYKDIIELRKDLVDWFRESKSN